MAQKIKTFKKINCGRWHNYYRYVSANTFISHPPTTSQEGGVGGKAKTNSFPNGPQLPMVPSGRQSGLEVQVRVSHSLKRHTRKWAVGMATAPETPSAHAGGAVGEGGAAAR